MAKGLSINQKKILTIINNDPVHNIRYVYNQIKRELFPELHYSNPNSYQKGYTKEYWENSAKLNKARSTISRAVRSLIHRGLVIKYTNQLYITELGKDIISVNDEPNINA